jgi:hypothetical protein
MERPPCTFSPFGMAGSWLFPGIGVLAILAVGMCLLTWHNAVTSRERQATQARQQAAAEQALQFAYKKGIGTAFTLLPEDLPRLAGVTGAHPITREIAIAALTNKVSFPLPLRSPEPPAFTPEGRWVIQILTSGDVLFSETVFLNAPKYRLTAQASAVRVSGNTLYLLEQNNWTKRQMELKPGAIANLGLPESLHGLPPDTAEPSAVPMFKIVHPADTTLAVLAAADGTIARLWSSSAPPPWAAVLSPDARFLAVHEKSHIIHIWNLQRLREELARLQLDWAMPSFPDPREDEADWGLVSGTGIRSFPPFVLPPLPQRDPKEKPAVLTNRSPRRRVVLPIPKTDQDALPYPLYPAQPRQQ